MDRIMSALAGVVVSWAMFAAYVFTPDSVWERLRGAVRSVWVRAGHPVRLRWLCVRHGVRRAVAGVSLRWRLVGVDVRRRWGFLRAAGVLARVSVPVAVCRYVPATLREEMRRFPGDVVDVIRVEWFLITGKVI